MTTSLHANRRGKLLAYLREQAAAGNDRPKNRELIQAMGRTVCGSAATLVSDILADLETEGVLRRIGNNHARRIVLIGPKIVIPPPLLPAKFGPVVPRTVRPSKAKPEPAPVVNGVAEPLAYPPPPRRDPIHGCQWIEGDPMGKTAKEIDAMKCGKACVPGPSSRAYCKEHYERCYRPASPAELRQAAERREQHASGKGPPGFSMAPFQVAPARGTQKRRGAE